MSTETETTPPAPAPSAGLMARMAEKFGFKTEAVALTEAKEELAAMTLMANEATAEIEVGKAEIARQKTVIAGLNSKITGIEAVVPGITASADPSALLTQTITQKTTEQVAAMGLPPGTAPGNDPSANKDEPEAMALADFNQLSVNDRNAYMAKGGKLK